MQNIRWVSPVASNPVGDIFAEAATNLRIETHYVIFAERFQACIRPVTHWDHDRLLIHFEITCLVELQTSFPCVTKTIRPLAGVTILFVPDKFLRPQPT